MSVELSPELERRVSEAVLSGRFGTRERLVETAIERLLEPPQEPAQRSLRGSRLSLDPPLIPPAGRHIDLTNERIHELN
jgi:Arc/MetJ-type ribon-helix-helix transcriptional regulator